MNVTQTVGRTASVVKYDVLTAMGAYALAHGKHEQRLILRFITLVVARYNWQRDELPMKKRFVSPRTGRIGALGACLPMQG